MIHPGFYDVPIKTPPYDTLIVDESQDFSRLQLSKLKNLAKPSQTCWLVDGNQSLQDNISIVPYLLEFIETKNLISLPVAYRCPQNVVTTANGLLAIKKRLVGGQLDKVTTGILENGNDEKGEVIWLDSAKEIQNYPDLTGVKTPDFAVVTMPEFIKEAEEIYETAMIILTPEQINRKIDDLLYQCFILLNNDNKDDVEIRFSIDKCIQFLTSSSSDLMENIKIESFLGVSFSEKGKADIHPDNKEFEQLINRNEGFYKFMFATGVVPNLKDSSFFEYILNHSKWYLAFMEKIAYLRKKDFQSLSKFTKIWLSRQEELDLNEKQLLSKQMALAINKGVFENLFITNCKIAQQFDMEVFYANHTEHSSTPFFLLTTTEKNLNLLKLIFQINPKLKSNFPPSALCFQKKNSDSALSNLSHSEIGCHILKSLFEENGELAKEIPSSILSRSKYGNSPFNNLLKTDDGKLILRKILTNQPDLIKECPDDALRLLGKIETEEQKHVLHKNHLTENHFSLFKSTNSQDRSFQDFEAENKETSILK